MFSRFALSSSSSLFTIFLSLFACLLSCFYIAGRYFPLLCHLCCVQRLANCHNHMSQTKKYHTTQWWTTKCCCWRKRWWKMEIIFFTIHKFTATLCAGRVRTQQSVVDDPAVHFSRPIFFPLFIDGWIDCVCWEWMLFALFFLVFCQSAAAADTAGLQQQMIAIEWIAEGTKEEVKVHSPLFPFINSSICQRLLKPSHFSFFPRSNWCSPAAAGHEKRRKNNPFFLRRLSSAAVNTVHLLHLL